MQHHQESVEAGAPRYVGRWTALFQLGVYQPCDVKEINPTRLWELFFEIRQGC